MKKLYAMALAVCCLGSAFGQTEVTLSVDMNGQTVSPDGVHVAGNFQGWDPSATPMTDDDGDGVYTYVFTSDAPAHIEFKFLNGNDWPFVEDVPSICQVELFGNDNRYIDVAEGETSASYSVCWASCAACGMTAVMFRVDMSLEAAVSPNGVHVAGEFQGWDPAATPLSDPDGDGIWTLFTVFDASAITGDLEYKYVNGNAWTNPNENISGDCSDGTGNRVLVLDGANLLTGVPGTNAAHCYNSCGSCVAPTQVTFRVDMTTQSEVSENGVHVAGTFQGWNPGGTALTDDDGDGVWEVTLGLQQGPIQFKFVNGNAWGGEGAGNVDNESINGACAAAGSDNRFLEIGADAIEYVVCYNSCDPTCVANPDPADITFRVDMSNETVAASGVWVMGGFTSPQWQAGAIQMTDDDGDGTYETTYTVDGGAEVVFKFVNGDPSVGTNGTDYFEESGIYDITDPVTGEPVTTNFQEQLCGVPNPFGAFNRLHIRSGVAEVLYDVCYNSCANCAGVIGIDEVAALQGLQLFPNPTSGFVTLSLIGAIEPGQVRLYDLSGRTVYAAVVPADQLNAVTLDLSGVGAGLYVVECVSGVARWTGYVVRD
ncbi:MAG: T9SS type A sorting domain-containing protein [Flavobacteriales bacterium]